MDQKQKAFVHLRTTSPWPYHPIYIVLLFVCLSRGDLALSKNLLPPSDPERVTVATPKSKPDTARPKEDTKHNRQNPPTYCLWIANQNHTCQFKLTHKNDVNRTTNNKQLSRNKRSHFWLVNEFLSCDCRFTLKYARISMGPSDLRAQASLVQPSLFEILRKNWVNLHRRRFKCNCNKTENHQMKTHCSMSSKKKNNKVFSHFLERKTKVKIHRFELSRT